MIKSSIPYTADALDLARRIAAAHEARGMEATIIGTRRGYRVEARRPGSTYEDRAPMHRYIDAEDRVDAILRSPERPAHHRRLKLLAYGMATLLHEARGRALFGPLLDTFGTKNAHTK